MKNNELITIDNTDVTMWDFPALRERLEERLARYEKTVYTDENIKAAKDDRKLLKDVKSSIETERKKYKEKCLAPYNAIEPEIKSLVAVVDRHINAIDSTVKDFEKRQKEIKRQEIRDFYDRKSAHLGALSDALFPVLLDEKWLNASTARNKYEQGVLEAINLAAGDIEEIKKTKSPFEEALLRVYSQTMSMDAVKSKAAELAESLKSIAPQVSVPAQAAEAPKAAESAPAQPDGAVTLKIYADEISLNRICDFMKAIGVRYERV